MKRVMLVIAAAAVLAGTGATASHVRSVAAAPVVQPGVSLDFGGSFCTMNWVYNGSGGPYVGAARHCTTGVGQDVFLATGSLGTDVEHIGKVAFVSTTQSLDYCLIKVDAGITLSAAMAGHPAIPKGVATPSDAKQGDLIQFSGHGIIFDATTITQQQRVGIFNFFASDGTQNVLGPVTPGDSGGPVADITDGNTAIGIVDTVGVTVQSPNANVGEGGAALYALIADASAHFTPITLATV